MPQKEASLRKGIGEKASKYKKGGHRQPLQVKKRDSRESEQNTLMIEDVASDNEFASETLW